MQNFQKKMGTRLMLTTDGANIQGEANIRGGAQGPPSRVVAWGTFIIWTQKKFWFAVKQYRICSDKKKSEGKEMPKGTNVQ